MLYGSDVQLLKTPVPGSINQGFEENTPNDPEQLVQTLSYAHPAEPSGFI